MATEDKPGIPPVSPKDQEKIDRPQKTQHEQKKGGIKWGGADKTLWDWLLLLGTLAIPIVLTVASAWFSVQNSHDLQIAAANRQQDLAISKDQQQQTTLETYLDQMQQLLINSNLSDPQAPDQVRVVARARTLVALSKLDPDRKRTVLQFLYEAHLLKIPPKPLFGPLVDLAEADLSGANLSGIILAGADLSGANLSGAVRREVT